MNVFYDRKNDVVSIYLDTKDAPPEITVAEAKFSSSGRNIEDVEEAANLLLDMVDIVDKGGNLVGFRFFNASKHYDIDLLDSADSEELTSEELNKRLNEKVIGVFKKD